MWMYWIFIIFVLWAQNAVLALLNKERGQESTVVTLSLARSFVPSSNIYLWVTGYMGGAQRGSAVQQVVNS